MMYEKVKRNRFYEPPSSALPAGFSYPHEGLHHYQDTEEFHRILERMHNANFHDWGIGHGLEVGGAVGGIEIVIQSGVAFDGHGRLISLSTDGHGDIGENPPGGQHNEVPVPVHLSLGTHKPGTGTAWVYVTVAFSEILRPAEGSGGRMEQVPWVRLQPTAGGSPYVDDGTAVILAVVEIDASGNLVSLSAEETTLTYRRRLSGQTIEELHIHRSTKVGNSVEEETSGKVKPGDGGGLQITVPEAGNTVSLKRETGGNFANLEIRSNFMEVKDSDDRTALRFNSRYAWLTVGTKGNEGDLEVKDTLGRQVFHFDGESAVLNIGTEGNAGDIIVRDGAGRQVMNFNSNNAALYVGANGNEGDIIVRDGAGRDVMHFDSTPAALNIGASGNAGDIIIKDGAGRQVMNLSGSNAALYIGASGNEGDIVVRDGAGRDVMHFDSNVAALYLGAAGNEGNLIIKNNSGAETARIDGQTGRLISNGQIITSNPARYARFVILTPKGDGPRTVTADIDIGSSKQFLAFTAIVGMDPLGDFDKYDAFATEVYRVDGVSTSNFWRWHNGRHFGSDGSTSNFHSPIFSGTGRVITFRARTFDNAGLFAIGLVFHE